MNPLGITAVVISLVAFAVTYKLLRSRPLSIRLSFFAGFTLLAVPATWFAVYYLHVLPEYEWFYTLRSWPGSEFLAIFIGCAGGAAAALLHRLLLVLPLFAVLLLTVVPYLKPLLAPLNDASLKERWQGNVCLQSTLSTCGPASVTTILHRLDVETTERATARAAFSYAGGTEAWYLARYVRRCGLAAHFAFRESFSPEAGLPALVGVRFGGGHFIAVLDAHDNQITIADPLRGEEQLSLAEFNRRYVFTGFQMVIQRN